MITKEDVTKALAELNLSNEEVSKAGDLGPAEGAAEEAGSLGVEGESMSKEVDKGKKKEEKADKSFYEELPAEVEAKVEVSTFLKSLVDYTASQMDALKDRVVKSDSAQDVRYENTMEQLDQVTKSLGHIGVVLKAVCERIGVLEDRPMPAKAVTKSMDAPIDRKFVGMESATGGLFKSLEDKSPVEVKKSITEAMFDLFKKGEMSDTDLINFETFGYITPEASKLLNKIL